MRNRLRELRAERGWTQANLAERLKVSRQTVNAVETGRYDPSLPLAFAIADVFDARIEDVFIPGQLPGQLAGRDRDGESRLRDQPEASQSRR